MTISRAVRGVHETNTARDLNLVIEPEGTFFRLRVQTADPDLQKAFGDDLEHVIPLTASELWGLVQSCREVWRTALVDHPEGKKYPFQEAWDFQQRADLRQAVLPKLAEAGAKLFLALFFPRPPGNTEAYEGLRRIGRVLRQEMNRRTRWVKVTSDSFFVPWGMIYSDSLDLTGSNVRPEGFWGYQHLIEHSPPTAGSLAYELDNSGTGFEMALQVDQAIDQDLQVDCLASFLKFLSAFEGQSLVLHKRLTKSELAKALRDSQASDQVLFFCCHALQEGDLTTPRIGQGYMILSDRSKDESAIRITPADITYWMDMKDFGRHPLVFLNACGSGQLNSVFYQGFGKTFLGLRASSVIGAETELPAVFAGEFARRFFEAFFQGGEQNKIGTILFRLRREFLDRYNNPLGLIYSLYRGADSYLEVGLSPRANTGEG
ncbi:MAG TPA: CHAT domain-containing protein [Thermoanaerobaculia bacterium]